MLICANLQQKKSKSIVLKVFSVVLSSILMTSNAWAQMNPVGTWRSIDDKTGKPKAQIVIEETGATLTGKIVKILREGADPQAVCKECDDDRKDKPMAGLEIIRGVNKQANGGVWEGGKILDPESGKSYTLKLTPIEEGKKLQVRGSILGIGRTQTWERLQ